MSYSGTELFLFFGLISLGTVITRALPFLIFREDRKLPKFVKYLSDVLPFTTIGMLVVYCLKDVSFTSAPFALPEIISIAAIAILHLVKKNTLLSIGIGTVLYMILINFVF